MRFSKREPEFSSISIGFGLVLATVSSLVLASTLALMPYGLESAVAQLGFGQDNSDQFGGGGSTDQFGGGGSTDQFGGGGSTDQFGGGGSTDQFGGGGSTDQFGGGGSTDQFGGGGSTDQFGGGGSTDQFGGGGSTDQFGGGGSTDQFGGGGSTDQFGGGGGMQSYRNTDYGISLMHPSDWTESFESGIASDASAAGTEYITSFETGYGATLRLVYHPSPENIPADQYNPMYYDAIRTIPETQIIGSEPIDVGADLPGGMMVYIQTPTDGIGRIGVFESWGKLASNPYGFLHFEFVANDLNTWETYAPVAADIMGSVDLIQ